MSSFREYHAKNYAIVQKCLELEGITAKEKTRAYCSFATKIVRAFVFKVADGERRFIYFKDSEAKLVGLSLMHMLALMEERELKLIKIDYVNKSFEVEVGMTYAEMHSKLAAYDMMAATIGDLAKQPAFQSAAAELEK